ncbi:MAG: hypothetical protein KDB88_05105 [Flavobacteriales bacterium]|nr:hypothetical protein [Flavobacteriales bacterium]
MPMPLSIRMLVLFALMGATEMRAQAPDALYAVSNPLAGVFEFVEFDLGSGNVAVFQGVPISSISSAASACIDVGQGLYHFCTGNDLYSFDANNVLPASVNILPIWPGAEFTAMEHDPCSGQLIGILNDPPNLVDLVAYDLNTNQFNTILALPTTMYFLGGAQAAFDPVARLYLLQTAAGFLGVNVDSGTVVYDTPISVPAGLIGFGHLAYDCTDQRLLGTAVGDGVEGNYGKFLCELDPMTGMVSVVSTSPSPEGVWKPMLGSSTIDLGTDLFYWSGVDDLILGAQTGNGSMVYNTTATAGDLNLIEHFSGCACGLATVVPGQLASPLDLWPTLAADRIAVQGLIPGEALNILDVRGRIIRTLRATGERMEIDLAWLAPGSYFFGNGRSLHRFSVVR